ncbi:MAG: ATP-binding protein [Candidatus Omnitrophota bacterium]
MAKFTKVGYHISSRIGKAIGDYDMIQGGDKILVGVSGGKDSLTLLKLLVERKSWAPVKFEVFAGVVESDFACNAPAHNKALKKMFKTLGVKHKFKKIKILDENNQTSCFWCAWTRKKTLFKIAGTLGCNKVALVHHKDDIIETTLLNLFFQGALTSMNPKQEFFGGKLTTIRPLCYVEEKMMVLYAKENNFPLSLRKRPCTGDNNRKYIKKLIKDLEKRSPSVKTNLFKSVSRIKQEGLSQKPV